MELMERDPQLAVLAGVLAEARDRRGAVVVVDGDAGMGKTALVRAFVADVPAGTRVLTGSCDDLVTPRVLGPLKDAAAGSGPLARAIADRGDLDGILEGLLAELDSPIATTVLVIEDVHWADEATLDAVGFVGRRIGTLPALIVLTYRGSAVGPTDPVRRLLGTLPAGTVHHLDLGPLSVDAVGRICGCDHEEARRIHAASAGNPFFVHEVARWGDRTPPPTVRDAVLARVQRLPAEEQEALALLSVFPTAAERDLFQSLSDAAALDEAERQGLVLVEPLRVGFVHDLARQAVAASLPTTTRLAHHAAAARRLASHDADPARILHHAVAGGLTDLVAAHAPAAARSAAAVGSHREALAHLEQLRSAAHLLSDGERAAAFESLAWELQLAGRHDEAVDVAEAAVRIRRDDHDPEALAGSLLVASRAHYWSAGQAAGRPLADEAVALLDGRPASGTQALAFAHHARIDLLRDDLEAAAGWAQRALAVTREVPEELAEVGARVTLAGVEFLRDGAPPDELEALARTARELGHHETALRAEILLGSGLLRWGRAPQAASALAAALDYVTDHDVEYGRRRIETLLALVEAEIGELGAASGRLADEGGDEIEYGGILPAAVRALVDVRAGRDAHADAGRAWTAASGTGEIWQVGIAGWARAESAWHADDAGDLGRLLEPAVALAIERDHGWLLGHLLVSLDRAGVEPPRRDHPGLSAADRASLAGDRERAADAYERAGLGFQAAVERARSADRAVALRGLEALDRGGAEGTAAVARRWLRRAGIRNVPRGPQAGTRADPAGLTPRQADVLRLVADGLTNAEIASRLVLSVRTVDHHVSAILGKLGVSSRDQAAARYAELHPDPDVSAAAAPRRGTTGAGGRSP